MFLSCSTAKHERLAQTQAGIRAALAVPSLDLQNSGEANQEWAEVTAFNPSAIPTECTV